MKQYTSPEASRLIALIGREHAMQAARVASQHIFPAQLMPILKERLNRLACADVGLRAFLDDVGPIPDSDDERMDVEWALISS